MQKRFYVSKNTKSDAPGYNRFMRITQLNALLSQGWIIKEFVKEDNEEFFVIEKN